MRQSQSPAAQDDAYRAGLDLDTVQYGTFGPFEDWESDGTALVHVLWAARRSGADLVSDAPRIAAMILGSRFLAAARAHTAEGNPPVRGFTTAHEGHTGSADDLATILEDGAATGLTFERCDELGEFICLSGWFAAVQASATLAMA